MLGEVEREGEKETRYSLPRFPFVGLPQCTAVALTDATYARLTQLLPYGCSTT
jgi:hypothetical protein